MHGIHIVNGLLRVLQLTLLTSPPPIDCLSAVFHSASGNGRCEAAFWSELNHASSYQPHSCQNHVRRVWRTMCLWVWLFVWWPFRGWTSGGDVAEKHSRLRTKDWLHHHGSSTYQEVPSDYVQRHLFSMRSWCICQHSRTKHHRDNWRSTDFQHDGSIPHQRPSQIDIMTQVTRSSHMQVREALMPGISFWGVMLPNF